MLKVLFSSVLASLLLMSSAQAASNPIVIMQTSLGEVRIEVLAEQAPKSAENFIAYVEDGFYDGLIFHRVIPGFMAQGGGFETGMKRKSPREAIANEADNGIKNVRGTLAMARTNNPHSATSQFFINLVDNQYLDYRSKSGSGWGYAVFARVVGGMDVVEAMAQQATTNKGGHQNVPREDIVILKAQLEKAITEQAE